jgi:hypothetical protein
MSNLGQLSELAREFYIVINLWSGYPIPYDVPDIKPTSTWEINHVACSDGCRKWEDAYYNEKDNSIYIDDRLQPLKFAEDAATLIHELAHHMQYLNGAFLNTGPMEHTYREKEATQIAQKWLEKCGPYFPAQCPIIEYALSDHH